MSVNVAMKPMYLSVLVLSVLSIAVCPLSGNAQESGAAENSAPAGTDPRIGQRVIVTKAGAEMRTPDAIVWKAYLGEVFTVTLTNGEWLWIDEKGGWIWEKETVLFNTAIDELSRRLTTTPTAESFHLRGVAFLAHQDYDKAIADFSESLRKSPGNAGALNNRGQASYLKGDYASAVQDFTAALAIDPKSFLFLNNRALAYIELENYSAALADLQSALTIIPEYPEALNNRGIVFQKLNRLDEAIADFTAALKIDPKYVDALGNRSYTRQLKNDLPGAIADLEMALKVNPLSYEAMNDLAWLLSTAASNSLRNGSRAVQLATQACELTGNSQWNTLDTLAAAKAEVGDFEGARQAIELSVQLAPDQEKARLKGHQASISEKKPIRN
ncbi:MAG: tetratricopeptide repeat protein [Planctomycetota bacterium]